MGIGIHPVMKIDFEDPISGETEKYWEDGVFSIIGNEVKNYNLEGIKKKLGKSTRAEPDVIVRVCDDILSEDGEHHEEQGYYGTDVFLTIASLYSLFNPEKHLSVYVGTDEFYAQTFTLKNGKVIEIDEWEEEPEYLYDENGEIETDEDGDPIVEDDYWDQPIDETIEFFQNIKLAFEGEETNE